MEAPLASDPLAAPDGSPVLAASNVDAAGALIPPDDIRMVYLGGNGLWHSDGSFREAPVSSAAMG